MCVAAMKDGKAPPSHQPPAAKSAPQSPPKLEEKIPSVEDLLESLQEPGEQDPTPSKGN